MQEEKEMDRKSLIELFRKGMQYPTGKRRFWIARCFEITVRPDSVVEMDEYEGFSSDHDGVPEAEAHLAGRSSKEMFHVGRSVLHLKDGRVVDEEGQGWKLSPSRAKKPKRA